MKNINSYTKGNYTVLLIKNETPIFGGFYSVELSYNDNVIKEKDGLNLDAAHELFFNTINAI